jgi:hypothetical protein
MQFMPVGYWFLFKHADTSFQYLLLCFFTYYGFLHKAEMKIADVVFIIYISMIFYSFEYFP